MMGVFVQLNEGNPNGMSKANPIGYVIQENGCWDWVGTRNRLGYGKMWHRGQMHLAHRVMYEKFRAPIPAGMTIDHLCRNRLCVNPGHMEAVTLKENLLRGESPSARSRRQTHCSKGHELGGDNVCASDKRLGWRKCRACNIQRKYDRRHRREAA